ncbi:hypothetical protein COLO4_27607 [Corchorus olitorius]|uniref:Leucine-rich repeat-containing N-terminal plant-type domain-containing protein n=1 Tax=Corchorus olitorius TaxID=93759 RepID=A0A1R3HPX6_9ROSI|nr:hypothetical protein COLO4_27607 [Corchorus olitorius]
MASKIALVGILNILTLLHLFSEILPLHASKLNPNSCSVIERDALLKFKEDLDDSAGRLVSWVGDDCCKEWLGVECNQETGKVTKLDLRNPSDPFVVDLLTFQSSQLRGNLNPSLLELKSLEYLDLSLNNFENTPIPDFIGSLHSLTYLNLSLSSFVGLIPPNLGNLSNLVFLDLHAFILEFNNVFPIPNIWVSDLNWISQLPSLQYLNLGYVNLSLASDTWLHEVNKLPNSLHELHLPSCHLQNLPISLPVVNFSSIHVINLRDNNLTSSSIPQWLFSLCNLQTLVLSFNQISGELNDFVGGLSKCKNISLEVLRLSFNQLSGEIPNTLGNLKNLKHLALKNNFFSGSIPEPIEDLSNLEILVLSANKLNGTVPEFIGRLNKLVFMYLEDNYWEGVISDSHFLQLKNLKEFVFSSGNNPMVFNVSKDWVPPFSLQLLNISNCQMGSISNSKFPSWLQTQKDLVFLRLQNVGISDQIPDWFWELTPQLQVLDLSHNKLQGKLPKSLVFPIPRFSQVDLSFNQFDGPIPLWQGLSFLSLRNNLFSGPIPENIGQGLLGVGMNVLDLSWNSLNGSIPSSLTEMLNLKVVSISNNQLSGNIPPWENNLQQLLAIDLSGNNLLGSIPISLCSQLSLQILSFSNNNLTGKIPPCLGILSSSLRLIDMSRNHLEGEIPEEITSLSELRSLNLSWNQLTGKIPNQIERLEDLQTLDLSNNHLSGPIPAIISFMPLLNQLNLSNNDLSGQIPAINQLKPFNDPSIYEGNPKLCGPPLKISCSKSTKNDNGYGPKWFLWLSVVVGCLVVVGLLTACGGLIIKSSWRNAYFQFVDESKERISTSFNSMPLVLKGKKYWERL